MAAVATPWPWPGAFCCGPRLPSGRHALFPSAPHSLVRLQSFRRRFGWRATLARVVQELRGRASAAGPGQAPATGQAAGGAGWAPVAQGDSGLSAPICFYLTPRRNRHRVTVVGESFDLRQPSDSATTALILATAAAHRLGADLRVVTRTHNTQPDQLDELLQLHGVSLQGEVMFQCAPVQGHAVELDRFDDELFLVTSWQSAAATLALVPPRQVVYLVQTDERALLPRGDKRALCEAVLKRQDLRFVVHTRQLKDHLVEQGLPHFKTQAVSFEPAFPAPAWRPLLQGPEHARRFIFHAAPGADRDLFRLGLATIEKALTLGLLDPKRWDLLFVGRNMPEVVLASGRRPRHLNDLDATSYLQLLGQADLGLSLSPPGLPSRVPLEMAASGAIVVVNGAAGPVARNIIACKAEVDALLQGLRTAIGAVDGNAGSEAPDDGSRHWSRNWSDTLHGTLDHLAAAR